MRKYINLTGSQNFNRPDTELNLKGVKFACDNIIAAYIRERFTLITDSRRTTSTFKLQIGVFTIMPILASEALLHEIKSSDKMLPPVGIDPRLDL